MIKVNELKFRYRNSYKFVVNDLTFAIEQGSLNVLLGLNGCGKTTLLKIFASILTQTSGTVEINGKNIRDYSIEERSKEIVYVAQKTSNIDDFSVFDYLSFGLVNTTKFYQKPSQEKLDKIKKYASLLRIDNLLNKNLSEVSGGERQLISICSALLQNTKIILLDEPTSALDLSNQALILSCLKDICEREGKTIILSTHNPNHALFLDSNVFVMKDGKFLYSGQAKDIIKTELLKEVYGEKICLSSSLDYDEISFNK